MILPETLLDNSLNRTKSEISFGEAPLLAENGEVGLMKYLGNSRWVSIGTGKSNETLDQSIKTKTFIIITLRIICA